MGLIQGVQLHPLESIQGGMAEFYTPQSSDETMVVKIPANTIDDLFVHRNQTDQLWVVKGSCVLVILYDRQYHYIPLSANVPQVVTIPPRILHGSINLGDEDCLLVNAVLRHGQPQAKDYQPAKKPFEYDIEKAQLSLHNFEARASDNMKCLTVWDRPMFLRLVFGMNLSK